MRAELMKERWLLLPIKQCYQQRHLDKTTNVCGRAGLTPALHIITCWKVGRSFLSGKNSFVVVKLVSRVSLLLWSCSRSGLKRSA